MEFFHWLTSTNGITYSIGWCQPMEYFHQFENHWFKIKSVIFKPMDGALVSGTQGCIAWVSTEETIFLGSHLNQDLIGSPQPILNWLRDCIGWSNTEFASDGHFQYKIRCSHPRLVFWQWECQSTLLRVPGTLIRIHGTLIRVPKYPYKSTWYSYKVTCNLVRLSSPVKLVWLKGEGVNVGSRLGLSSRGESLWWAPNLVTGNVESGIESAA
jgi:hypothetical protein